MGPRKPLFMASVGARAQQDRERRDTCPGLLFPHLKPEAMLLSQQ